MSMTAYLQSQIRESPDLWGGPEDIGSQTIEGDVKYFGRFDIDSPGETVFGSHYSATRGQYRSAYGFHEHATLLEGEVALTNETIGETAVFGRATAGSSRYGYTDP